MKVPGSNFSKYHETQQTNRPGQGTVHIDTILGEIMLDLLSHMVPCVALLDRADSKRTKRQNIALVIQITVNKNVDHYRRSRMCPGPKIERCDGGLSTRS